MSDLNNRRHGLDLHVRDKDLLTGRDARAIIAQEFARRDAKDFESRQDDILRFWALPWWKRFALRFLAIPMEIE